MEEIMTKKLIILAIALLGAQASLMAMKEADPQLKEMPSLVGRLARDRTDGNKLGFICSQFGNFVDVSRFNYCGCGRADYLINFILLPERITKEQFNSLVGKGLTDDEILKRIRQGQ